MAAASPHIRVRGTVAGTFTEYLYTPYQRKYKVYIPSGYVPGIAVPLLVMLHGCTQNPEDFALGTEMNWHAEHATCIVVYPDQSRRENLRRCWNWFDARNQLRGRGEAAAIMAIVDKVLQTYTIDREHIYAAGMSAGGSMAIILGATYPDVFAAIGVCAGVAYCGATNALSALRVMREGVSDPSACGMAAYMAMGSRRHGMPVIVFQGSADASVKVVNADHIIAQWCETNRLVIGHVHGISTDFILAHSIVHTSPGKRTYIEYRYASPDTGIELRKYLVEGMGHAWPGGSASGSFTDPYGPDASQLMLEFFFKHRLHALEVAVAPLPMSTVPVVVETRPMEPVAVADTPAPLEPSLLPLEPSTHVEAEKAVSWWQRIRQVGGRLRRQVSSLLRRVFRSTNE